MRAPFNDPSVLENHDPSQEIYYRITKKTPKKNHSQISRLGRTQQMRNAQTTPPIH
jgi:hypothetical protein